MNEELKPCPFCGSSEVNNTSTPTASRQSLYFWICPDCVAVGPIGESVEQATDAWNKRINGG